MDMQIEGLRVMISAGAAGYLDWVRSETAS